MGYSLVYVSDTSKDLKKADIQKVFDFTTDWNINHDISGFLVYKGGNFIQLLEGNEKTIKSLFKRISKDNRHVNVTIILEENISQHSFDGYESGFFTSQNNELTRGLLNYIDYLKLLENPKVDKLTTLAEQILKAM